MSSRKRQKTSRDLRCVLFPDDVRPASGRASRDPPALSSESSARSWQQCGDSFLDTPVMEKLLTSGRKLSSVSKLAQFNASGPSGRSEESVHISWSSSDSDPSDSERPLVPCRTTRAPPTATSQRDEPPDIESDSDESPGERQERDEGQQISDCDSESCEEEKPGLSPRNEERTDVEISQFGSESEDVPSSLASTRPDSLAGRRSLSDWVRSAQAMLQTPQKQLDRQSKTPEDSGRKRRKLLSGGLAQRLNCLQSRQRSAVSFWKHQSDPSAAVTSSGARPGLLLLEVLEVHRECGMHVARCERRGPPPPGDDHRHAGTDVLVLFNRETAAQLMPAPRDVIHIHPPWQSLCVEGFSCPVILNTHFSQKASSASTPAELAGRLAAPSRPPHHLGKVLVPLEAAEERRPPQSSDAACSFSAGLAAGLSGRPCVSLLEAIEGLGQAGCVEQEVNVVVQRVYSVPVSSCSPASILKSRARTRPSAPPLPPPPPPPPGEGQTRLCVLVQDDFGTFSVVQLHLLPSRDLLHHYCFQWQGRNCTLRAIKVVQRLTRERSCWLFSLIDSLWPPKIPVKHHGSSLRAPTEGGAAVPPPSFCYLLSGQHSSVRPAEPQTASPLYIQPEERSLRDILQNEGKTCRRCSFVATVLYKRIQSDGGGGGRPDFWLVLTDRSLQGDQTEDPSRPHGRRTLPLCIKPSCVLTPSVLAALQSPAACRMAFRDALREHGVLFCVEQSVVQLCSTDPEASILPRPDPEASNLPRPDPEASILPRPDPEASILPRPDPEASILPRLDPEASILPRPDPEASILPRPVRLDPLSEEAWPCSLCRLSGVIVGVDQDSAFSWPTCSHCGSEDLEISTETPQNFLCVSCRSEVNDPDVKVQLEVFLSCSSLSDATVKVKLQQSTIRRLLNATTSNRTQLSGLDVESILGKEVGPMAAYVRVVTRSPSLWIGLDQVPLET